MKKSRNRWRAREWREKRIAVQNGKCYYCRRKMVEGDQNLAPTLDHKVPLARGGQNDYKNTVACCLTCNRFKGSLPPAKFDIMWRAEPWIIRGRELEALETADV
jgi:5-methylcytosine-specific restriction enzyme A